MSYGSEYNTRKNLIPRLRREAGTEAERILVRALDYALLERQSDALEECVRALEAMEENGTDE